MSWEGSVSKKILPLEGIKIRTPTDQTEDHGFSELIRVVLEFFLL